MVEIQTLIGMVLGFTQKVLGFKDEQLAEFLSDEQMEWESIMNDVVAWWMVAISASIKSLDESTHFDSGDLPDLIEDMLDALGVQR